MPELGPMGGGELEEELEDVLMLEMNQEMKINYPKFKKSPLVVQMN